MFVLRKIPQSTCYLEKPAFLSFFLPTFSLLFCSRSVLLSILSSSPPHHPPSLPFSLFLFHQKPLFKVFSLVSVKINNGRKWKSFSLFYPLPFSFSLTVFVKDRFKILQFILYFPFATEQKTFSLFLLHPLSEGNFTLTLSLSLYMWFSLSLLLPDFCLKIRKLSRALLLTLLSLSVKELLETGNGLSWWKDSSVVLESHLTRRPLNETDIANVRNNISTFFFFFVPEAFLSLFSFSLAALYLKYRLRIRICKIFSFHCSSVSSRYHETKICFPFQMVTNVRRRDAMDKVTWPDFTRITEVCRDVRGKTKSHLKVGS